MLLPTRNENFGYVILEALLAGCPVILSDQTPWRDLDEKQAGWVIPLGDEAGFVRALDAAIQMDAGDFHRRSTAAYQYAASAAANPAAVGRLRDLLAGAGA
jgi:glycosyltransferase involved in cell wall biosynthesis